MADVVSGESLLDRLLGGQCDFKGIVLERAFDLSGHPRFAELQERLRRSADSGALDFSGARLTDLKARGWQVPGSIWVGAQLDGCDFSEAQFDLADLSRASLCRANLGRCALTGATCVEINLESSNLEEAKLDGVNFWKGRLRNAIFHKAQLRDALLCEADLSGADFSACDLTKGNLWGASLEGASFARALLRETQIKGVRELDKALGLSRARYRKCRMGRAERDHIVRAMDRLAFHVEE